MKTNLSIAVTVLYLLCPLYLKAQAVKQPEGYLMGYVVENGDTLFVSSVPELNVYQRDKKKSDREWREFYRTVHNFSRAYPFALQARERIDKADSIMAVSNFTPRERERFLEKIERDLFAEFEAPLRKLTFTQGRILLRLIDREIGQTSYAVVKSYRGGLTASFWQGVARIFGADMKKPYDKYGEDRLLEELVGMYHDGRFYYLYFSLFGPPKDPNISPYGTRWAN
ncbi:MAG: DUF4294 domain-containing protein [Bacteroidales bacterium]|nr:DUF4294 domain-containing protein [Bacteroidales bacterium]MDD4030698.1 DUF4294 domain-containing protein [Bacteroidales bacterium]MDD4436022.1 DUF4294 domain-containing protein [Bacteroidales bacterium]MDD5733181.1 DUF4294 domain-containing protein [Bacteroidales bacterium]